MSEASKPTVKPGWQTSEHAVTWGALISAVMIALAAPDPVSKICAWATAAGAIAAYIYTRYAHKSAAAPSDPPKTP